VGHRELSSKGPGGCAGGKKHGHAKWWRAHNDCVYFYNATISLRASRIKTAQPCYRQHGSTMAVAHEWDGGIPQKTCVARAQTPGTVQKIGAVPTPINNLVTLFKARIRCKKLCDVRALQQFANVFPVGGNAVPARRTMAARWPTRLCGRIRPRAPVHSCSSWR
jgi:hypothetical protein